MYLIDGYLYRTLLLAGRGVSTVAQRKSPMLTGPINKAIFGPHLERAVHNYTSNSSYYFPNIFVKQNIQVRSDRSNRSSLNTKESQISSPPLHFRADIQQNTNMPVE
jgi:hypothetical protein